MTSGGTNFFRSSTMVSSSANLEIIEWDIGLPIWSLYQHLIWIFQFFHIWLLHVAFFLVFFTSFSFPFPFLFSIFQLFLRELVLWEFQLFSMEKTGPYWPKQLVVFWLKISSKSQILTLIFDNFSWDPCNFSRFSFDK